MSIREYVIAASVMIFILWLQFVMLLPLNKKNTKKEKIIIMHILCGNLDSWCNNPWTIGMLILPRE